MFEGKRTLADVQPYIDHQDLAIAKSIVAQFMNLGSGNSTSGSFALSSDQSEMFLMMLDSAAKNICNIINCHAIPELVGYNFASDLYPILSFKSMNSTKLINALKTLVDGKLVLPDDDLEVYIRDMLDLPEQNPAQSREEAIEQFKQNKLSIQQGNNKIPETNKSKTPIDNTSKQNQYKDKIKNDKINKNMKENSSNIKFSEISMEALTCLKDLIKKQLIKLNEKAQEMDINNLSSIKIQYKGELSKFINDLLKNELKFKESDIKFTAKSNIISNTISEKVKSMFLNEYINNTYLDIDIITQDIINEL
jgi:hypothetical protein